jgi:preprotein translocase subunit YajC
VIATLLAAQTSNPNGFAGLLIFVPLILVFYFVMIRPQRNRVRQHQDLLAHIEVGDEVETIGGIYGTIRGVTDEEFLLDVAPGTTVRISRGAVRRKIYEPDETEEEQETPGSTS